jgi:hypothetical protein
MGDGEVRECESFGDLGAEVKQTRLNWWCSGEGVSNSMTWLMVPGIVFE